MAERADDCSGLEIVRSRAHRYTPHEFTISQRLILYSHY
jgi:hypothetical protein